MQRHYEEKLSTLICTFTLLIVILLQNPKPNPSPLYAESGFLHTLCSHHNAGTSRSSYRRNQWNQRLLLKHEIHLSPSTSAHYSPLCSQHKDWEGCLLKQHWDFLHLYHRSWRENNYHREETDITHLLQAPTLRIFRKLDYLTWLPHPDSLATLHLPSPSPLFSLFLFISSQMLWRWFTHFLVKSCTKTQGYLLELQTFQDMK